MSEKRICLLGGTFNPIHNGHLHIALSVSSILDAELVLFIPAGIPPHKKANLIPSGKHRLALLRLALTDCPRFQACDIEINRSGPSFTIDTIALLKQQYPDAQLIFIIGTDAFIQIKTWKDPERLLTLCDFAVISRPGTPFSRLVEISGLSLPGFSLIDTEKLKALDQAERRIYRVPMTAQTTLHLLSIPPCEISGTGIRKRIATGEPLRNILPRSVESYIIEHKIYIEDKNF